MVDVIGQATVVVGGQIDPNIGRDVAKSFDKVDDAMDDAVAALARVQSAVDDARATTGRAFGELGESSNLARDGFGDLSTAASAVGAGLAATGVISEGTAAKFTTAADALGGVEGAFTAVKGASSLVGSAFTSMSGKIASSTVVTKAATVAQRALNLVLRANPIGLVVTAIGLLVAGLVLAYKRSETFRNIVNGAFNSIKTAASAVFGFVGKLISVQVAAWSKAFSGVKKVLSTIWDGVKAASVATLDFIKDQINKVIRGINFAIRLVNKIPKVPDIPEIPYLASGVRNFRGGLAVVGERGPELVNLPAGSDVFSNRESRAALGSNVQIVQNFYGPTTGADRKREIDWSLRYGALYGPTSAFGGAA